MSIETAKEKLRKEAEGCGDIEKAIVTYLIGIMDEELAALVDRPEYTVKEMGSFVMTKAKKALNNKSGCLADEVVYGFATDYYHAIREEIKKAGAVKPTVKPATTKEEKKPEAKAAKPPKSIKAQQKAEEKKIKNASKPAKKGKPQPEGQMSLFDMLGGLADA